MSKSRIFDKDSIASGRCFFNRHACSSNERPELTGDNEVQMRYLDAEMN